MPEHAVSHSISALYLAHNDTGFLAVCTRRLHQCLVEIFVEWLPERFNRYYIHLFQFIHQFLIDQLNAALEGFVSGNAFCASVLFRLLRSLERALEIIDDVQQLLDDHGLAKRDHLLLFLLRPAPVILEISGLSLPLIRYLIEFLFQFLDFSRAVGQFIDGLHDDIGRLPVHLLRNLFERTGGLCLCAIGGRTFIDVIFGGSRYFFFSSRHP